MSSSQIRPSVTVSKLGICIAARSLDIPIGFPARNPQIHKDRSFEWRDLKTQKERDTFFGEYGVRWSELCRLPYFDPVGMTIIDPMHNLLLGKSFYSDISFALTSLVERHRQRSVVSALDSTQGPPCKYRQN